MREDELRHIERGRYAIGLCETDETLGIDLTQKSEGQMASGRVGNGYSVRNALLRCKGVRGFGDALDTSWLGMEPEGSGLALGARGWF